MRAFRSVTSTAVVLDRPDVDTDQIIPKQFLKRIERTGFGEFLFFDWRKDPDFELNHQRGKILLAGRNFGCGSSREHAPWALQDYGFEAIVAPSYGDIFRQNSHKIGLLDVQLRAEQVRALMDRARAGEELTVDLESRTAGGYPFELDDFTRECLLDGLDEIALTLRDEPAIAAYERAYAAPIATTVQYRKGATMGVVVVHADEVELQNGVFRPVTQSLGVNRFRVNRLELPPGAEGFEHDHTANDQEEVYVVVAGSGVLRVDGDEIPLRPGHFVLCPPDARRQMVAGDEGLTWIAIGSAT